MLRSMTGYGRSERTIDEKNFIIEIRSLNGKQFELLLKLPVQLKPYEFEIRSLLALVPISIAASRTLLYRLFFYQIVINLLL